MDDQTASGIVKNDLQKHYQTLKTSKNYQNDQNLHETIKNDQK